MDTYKKKLFVDKIVAKRAEAMLAKKEREKEKQEQERNAEDYSSPSPSNSVLTDAVDARELKRFASNAPDILCHTEKIAPGTVAIARSGKEVCASDVARPEFCIPIGCAQFNL